MFNVSVLNSIDTKKIKDVAKSAGKEKAKETAEKVFEQSQKDCPVYTGGLRDSGYIIELDDKYAVGYSAEHALNVNYTPQNQLKSGKTHFLTNALKKHGGINGGVNGE